MKIYLGKNLHQNLGFLVCGSAAAEPGGCAVDLLTFAPTHISYRRAHCILGQPLCNPHPPKLCTLYAQLPPIQVRSSEYRLVWLNPNIYQS